MTRAWHCKTVHDLQIASRLHDSSKTPDEADEDVSMANLLLAHCSYFQSCWECKETLRRCFRAEKIGESHRDTHAQGCPKDTQCCILSDLQEAQSRKDGKPELALVLGVDLARASQQVEQQASCNGVF